MNGDENNPSETNEARSQRFCHDLLNLLGAAKLNAQLMARSQQLSEPLKKNLERILDNLGKIQALISNLNQSELEASLPKTPSSKSDSDNGFGKKTVLLIDDSADMRSLFKVILPTDRYHVLVAKDEAEALTVLALKPYPDLILLDDQLGSATSSDLLDTLTSKGSDVFRESKIIIFTASPQHALDPRAHGYESKALDLNALLQLVERHTS